MAFFYIVWFTNNVLNCVFCVPIELYIFHNLYELQSLFVEGE